MKALRRTLIACGTLVMAYAISGALADTDVTFGVVVFLVAVLVAHDGLLLPLIIGAGVLITRIVPSRLRKPVRAAAVISLAVTVVAVPLLLTPGRVPGNPSILPLNYGKGLLVIYTIIWATTAVVVTASRGRHRRHRTEPQ